MSLTEAIRINGVDLVKDLLKLKGIEQTEYNDAIRLASHKGYTEVVKALLEDPNVDPSCGGNYPIRSAMIKGYTDLVELLLKYPNVDPYCNRGSAIYWVFNKGHQKILKLLMEDNRNRVDFIWIESVLEKEYRPMLLKAKADIREERINNILQKEKES